MIDEYRLAAADGIGRPRDAMTTRFEIGADAFAKTRLERQQAVERKAARRLVGALRVIAAIQHMGEEMRVPGGLELAAHDAERHHRHAFLRQQPWNDGVERPLPPRKFVGMTGGKREAAAAVLQQHAGFRRIDAAAKGREHRVDQRHRIAVPIDDGEIDGVAMDRPVPDRSIRCAVRPDFFPQPAYEGIAENVIDADRHVRRIGDQQVAHPVGGLGRLGEKVYAIRLAHRRIGKVKTIENAGDHQRCQSLPVRRAF